MASQKLNPRNPWFWIRVFILILAFFGVLHLMGYFQSGEFVQKPEVQGLLNPATEPIRKARLVIGTPASDATPAGTPVPSPPNGH